MEWVLSYDIREYRVRLSITNFIEDCLKALNLKLNDFRCCFASPYLLL